MQNILSKRTSKDTEEILDHNTLHEVELETITPISRNVNAPSQYTTKIAKTREDSILYESQDTADYKIFSDGSGHDDGIGAAAILYRKGWATPVKSLKIYLGPPTKHNMFEAEVIGAILAVWIIKNSPEMIGKKISLYVDNQATIMKSPKPTSGQHLIENFQTTANKLHCDLEVKWISSHSEVKGNEEVDKLAKDAASGRLSRAADLPPILRNPLPISASAIRQEFHASLNRKWKTNWNSSPRYDRMAQIDPDFPYNGFWRRLYNLTRNQASIIMQIRTWYMPINDYLKKIGKADSKNCMECNPDEPEEVIPETVNHFLFECPAHDCPRQELIAKISRRRLNLSDIMSNTDDMKAL